MLPSLLSFATEFASILLDATTFMFEQLSVFLMAEMNNLRRMNWDCIQKWLYLSRGLRSFA
jgi:hypothetical protein